MIIDILKEDLPEWGDDAAQRQEVTTAVIEGINWAFGQGYTGVPAMISDYERLTNQTAWLDKTGTHYKVRFTIN